MTNIQLFDEACARIFAKLYEAFPVPITFDQRDVGFYGRSDSSRDADLRRKVLHETLVFLKEEGFITFGFDPAGTSKVVDARLTSKGLTKLQRIPDGIKEGSKSLIEQLRDAFSSTGDKASAAALSEAVKRLVQLILG